MDSDNSLIEEFLNGGDEAFTTLVTRYQRPLYGFIFRMVRNREDAMDLCQKAFVQVFLKAEGFAGRSAFKTWLYRIAVNLSLNHIRSAARNPARPPLYDAAFETAAASSGAAALDTTIITIERRTQLQSAINELPEKQTTVVALRIYEELTFKEIADVMECAVGTARANFHHALLSLKKILEDDNGL